MTTTATATQLPTVRQMKARANDGHARVLECIASDRDIATPATAMPEVRGLRTCIATLLRWECITPDGEHLTDRGRELLVVLRAAGYYGTCRAGQRSVDHGEGVA